MRKPRMTKGVTRNLRVLVETVNEIARRTLMDPRCRDAKYDDLRKKANPLLEAAGWIEALIIWKETKP